MKLRAEMTNQFTVGSHYPFRSWSGAHKFTQYLCQGNQAVNTRGALGIDRIRTVGKFPHPVQNTDSNRFPALRADAMSSVCFDRFQADAAFSMTVTMIFTLFRIKLDGCLEKLSTIFTDRVF